MTRRKGNKVRLPGLPDNASYGEELEWTANFLPGKLDQMVEIGEEMAKKMSDFAGLLDSDPQTKKEFLRGADWFRSRANKIRLRRSAARDAAERAARQLEELK